MILLSIFLSINLKSGCEPALNALQDEQSLQYSNNSFEFEHNRDFDHSSVT